MPKLGQFKNLIGMRFGKLVVISLEKTTNHEVQRIRYWKCSCDCGGSVVIRGSHLTCPSSRSTITRSCGCERLSFQHGDKWKSKSMRLGTAFRLCLSKYTQNAKHRDLPWELTEEQFRVLTSSPCYYTGEMPSTVSKARSGEVYLYNGIDRLDNSKGYTTDNCVTCCWDVNMMKMDLPLSRFLELCRKISERKQV